MRVRQLNATILLLAAALAISANTFAQCTFTSGSTGHDGDFIPTNSMPSTGWSLISNYTVLVTLPTNGVFNFGQIYIETNWTVTFAKNRLNTPVYLLATNNVTIRGTINISGGGSTNTTGGLGGPGGFDGGSASPGNAYMGDGSGPGGGDDSGQSGAAGGFGQPGGTAGGPYGGGPAYGTLDIQPLIGGSGGSSAYYRPFGAGGGGGAILIASSGTINVSGAILANSGESYSGSGDGSGGAIRLIAQVILGEGALSAYDVSPPSELGGVGRIRLEACNVERVTLTDPPATFGSPGMVFLSTNPTIQVTSIAGQNTPAAPTGSFSQADFNLPSGFTNPATIAVSATNVPINTAYQVIVIPVWGTNSVGYGILSNGSYSASSGTVSMNVYTDRVWRVNALIPYIPRP